MTRAFKIGWCVFWAILGLSFLLGVSISKDGSALLFFSASVPLGIEGASSIVYTTLYAVIKGAVPLLFLLSGFEFLEQSTQAKNFIDRCAGLFKGLFTSLKDGLVMTQALLFPFAVLGIKFLPRDQNYELLMMNLFCIGIGIQYLLWFIVFQRLLRHQSGLALFFVFAFSEISTRMGFLVDFGESMGLKASSIQWMALFLPSLPIVFISLDALTWMQAGMALGLPLALVVALLAIS